MYTSRYKLHKKQVTLIPTMITVLLRVSLHEPTCVPQQRSCSEKQHLVHPAITFPDHLLRQCSTTLSQDTQRHLFFTSLCVVHLPVTPNDLQRWKGCYCSFCCCSLSCCELGILPVTFLRHGLHEGDLETS